MSHFIDWIAAEESGPNPLTSPAKPPLEKIAESPRQQTEVSPQAQRLPAHNFPPRAEARPPVLAPERPAARQDKREREENDGNRDPDLWLYRQKTISLLRRYMRWSLEAGRVPSLLGRELFRSRITSQTSVTFEARVIFLHDVERCLDRLNGFDRQIVARIVLQEHSHEAAARLLHCTRKTVERRVAIVLDELSHAFLKAELLTPFPQTHGGVQ